MTATYVSEVDSAVYTIQIGNGASPEVFAQKCVINTSRALKLTANATASVIARCDDPTQPGKTKRKVTSTDSSITGAGTLPAADAKFFADWLKSGVAKNIQVHVGEGTGNLIWSGPFLLTSFEITGGELGKTVDANLQFDQADDAVATAHA